jgi:cephalosporin-C deacetylase
MPVVDMPLAELKTYQGINPRPSDFDDYWETALRELEEQDSQLTIEPADFQTSYADCRHLWFRGVGGARVHAKLVQPKAVSNSPAPGVVKFHGYSMDSGNWTALLPYAAAGYTIAAMDCRGQGGLSEDIGGVRGNTLRGHIIRGLDDGPEKLLYRSIFLDTAQLTRIVMGLDGVDPSRIGVFGLSQGGALTLACAALEPRVKKAVSVFPFLSDYKRTWDMDLVEKAYVELKEYFRRFDPTHQREEEIFTRLGYIDVQHLAPRIKADVLMITALRDETCPPSTQFAAYNKIASRKEMIVYPDFGHEQLPRAEDSTYQFFLDL